MESIVKNVVELDAADRRALEHLLGGPLSLDQRVSISVVPAEPRGGYDTTKATPAWAKIYEGLSDEEIDRLDGAIRQRANLTRASE